ncbi:hypothetical protein FSARC_14305 [Fusarium sarcochroum]|uniref:Uncharacterized protein n=1 Tax=Fusarium sarcochroum TaxID=1208366 RepID=A0A8H4WQD3_9HYPO|nr:hypothetical protein FSARC_14305 [Fusarium sarcochroum]
MRNPWSRVLLIFLILAIIAFATTILKLSPLSAVIKRYPGDANSPVIREKAAECNAHDPATYGYLACSGLIGCILDRLGDIYKSDIAIGTTILGLLPSIMAVTAAQPEDIVQLALISPHRAVAIAAFGIGINPNAFERLRPLRHALGSTREIIWVVPLACLTEPWSWRHATGKIIADALILGMASVMLWRNWTVNSAVLVQWLCESPLMVFMWPVASMTWVAIAVLLLYAMADEVIFKHATQDIEHSWWRVVLSPYTTGTDIRLPWQLSWETLSIARLPLLGWLKRPALRPRAASRGVPMGNAVRIIIRMPPDPSFLDWEAYCFAIELCAIAIYFYATFVLLSVLFIGAVGSVRFACTVAGLYAGVRFMESIF